MNFNTQGIKRVEKRTLIEKYMKENYVDLAVITETHANTNHKETRKEFTWFFAGGDTPEHHHAGVAIVIKNKWVNTIEDVQPICQRVICMKLRHIIPIAIVGAYAPTAQADTEAKETFYETLAKTHQ